MNVTAFQDAPEYHPPEHYGMRCFRLQGMEAGPSDTLWMGVSEIAPGGHTSLSASSHEKLYLVLEGEVAVSNGETEAVLRRFDSCRIAPGEARALTNRSNAKALIALCMPLVAPK
ncbi:cupin domain-containing protein [Neoaquamicrobium sediminum]|uniref:cupin domain-containing protein n=1 Tax=Neoaquamicrobium sediminum TaxID=1849104 RepID=UPI0015651716|nr:cupin domain-containing protein [Mesorhizobium sediminum]NRC56873.1 cupin domain-containing protein [Mesorhizobium sediminum]